MHPVTLCVTSIEADAERPWRRYHAERGNDQVLFPSSHQFVTERPSVAQNHAHLTKPRPHKISPQKISSTPEPLIQALSSRARNFS
jgi:hypothetical protein